MSHDTLINSVLGELELTTYNLCANVIDDCHGTKVYLNLTLPTRYFRSVLHCEMQNVGAQRRDIRSVRWSDLLGLSAS